MARSREGSSVRRSQEVPVPIHFKGVDLECGYRCDLVIDDVVIVELKAIDRLLPIHDSQLLTYLKLSRLRVGLLINFNAAPIRTGIRRLVL
jgi:GxxExxY protein